MNAWALLLNVVVIVVGLVLWGLGGFVLAADLPLAELTPGLATSLTKSQICKRKWGKDARAVTASMKRRVFLSYGYKALNQDPRCPCEIDHLISRELGGADDTSNLWPQSYRGAWNAHDKDRLENRLHKELCVGNLTLPQVQDGITSDWTKLYYKYFGDE